MKKDEEWAYIAAKEVLETYYLEDCKEKPSHVASLASGTALLPRIAKLLLERKELTKEEYDDRTYRASKGRLTELVRLTEEMGGYSESEATEEELARLPKSQSEFKKVKKSK